MSHLDNATNDPNAPLEYESMDLENFVLQNFTEELESRKRSGERVPFHNHSSKALFSLIEDIVVSSGQNVLHKHQVLNPLICFFNVQTGSYKDTCLSKQT